MKARYGTLPVRLPLEPGTIEIGISADSDIFARYALPERCPRCDTAVRFIQAVIRFTDAGAVVRLDPCGHQAKIARPA